MSRDSLEAVWGLSVPLNNAMDLTGVVSRVHSSDGGVRSAVVRKAVAPRQQPGSDFVEALGHGLALMACWQDEDVWLMNSELAARSGLTRASVTRVSTVLVDLGYLARDCSKRGGLRLTSATLGLGFGSAMAAPIVASAQAELSALARELDVYAALSVRQFDRMLVLANVASPSDPDAVNMDVGGLLPICRSASGLAALAALPESLASPLMSQFQQHYGGRWIRLKRDVTRAKSQYMSDGYCTSVALLSRNVGAAAMPIVPAGNGYEVFALACAVRATEFCHERVQRNIAPSMLKIAHRLNECLSSR